MPWTGFVKSTKKNKMTRLEENLKKHFIEASKCYQDGKTPEEGWEDRLTESFIKENDKITDLKEIDTETKEGRLLFAALAKITTESQTDKTPYEVLEQLNELSYKMK